MAIIARPPSETIIRRPPLGITKHVDLTDKEVAGVIDHANASITTAKLVDNSVTPVKIKRFAPLFWDAGTGSGTWSTTSTTWALIVNTWVTVTDPDYPFWYGGMATMEIRNDTSGAVTWFRVTGLSDGLSVTSTTFVGVTDSYFTPTAVGKGSSIPYYIYGKVSAGTGYYRNWRCWGMAWRYGS